MAERTVAVRLVALTSAYQAAMARATASTQALQAKLAATQISGQTTTSVLQGLGLGSKVALGAAGLGVFALYKELQIASRAAIDFESSFAGIRKTVDGSEQEFAAIAEGMRDLSTEIPITVDELNRIGELGGQLDISKARLVDFTEVIAKLGETTDLTTEQGATSLAQFANVTQMAESEFSNLGSTIVDLGNNSAATESAIVDFGSRIAGAGEIAGLAESDILAIGTAMASVGVEVEAGGTAIQKVLLKITEAVNLGTKELETYAKTAGMSAFEFSAAWRSDPAQAFTAFVEGLGASGQDAIKILKDLGLTDQRLTRGFLSLAGAGDTLRLSVERGSQAWAENNALNEEASRRFETTASRMQLAQNVIHDLQITIGQELLPVLAEGATALVDFFLVAERQQDSLNASKDLMTQLADGVQEGTTSIERFHEVYQSLLAGEGLSEIRELTDHFWQLIAALQSGETVIEEGDNALGKLALNADGAAEGTEDLAGAQGDAQGAIEGATGAIEQQVTALDRLKGASGLLGIQDAALGVRDAQLSLKDAHAEVNRLVAEGKKGTREYENAVIDLRRANLGVVESQMSLVEAVQSYREKIESGEISQRDAISLIREYGKEAGLSRGYVDDLIGKILDLSDTYDRLPKEKRTEIEAKGLDEAVALLHGWEQALAGIPRSVTTTVRVTQAGSGGAYVHHSGGIAGSGPRRLSGSMRSDEVPAILQRGEVVLSKAQVAALSRGRAITIHVDARGANLTESQIEHAVVSGIEASRRQNARDSRYAPRLVT